jgi:hypothetical protein
MEQRVCTRCLLRELIGSDASRQAELDMIEKYRDAIKQADRVTKEEYERRLAVCQTCDKLFEGTCAACGCYVELRATAKVSRCPHKKW